MERQDPSFSLFFFIPSKNQSLRFPSLPKLRRKERERDLRETRNVSSLFFRLTKGFQFHGDPPLRFRTLFRTSSETIQRHLRLFLGAAHELLSFLFFHRFFYEEPSATGREHDSHRVYLFKADGTDRSKRFRCQTCDGVSRWKNMTMRCTPKDQE